MTREEGGILVTMSPEITPQLVNEFRPMVRFL